MGFFTKAVSEAVQDFPAVNAMIDGNEIVYSDFVDIGIAVSAPKGLVVPVVRNAESLTIPKSNWRSVGLRSVRGIIS